MGAADLSTEIIGAQVINGNGAIADLNAAKNISLFPPLTLQAINLVKN